jgi:cytosine/adenosine deaminase-related metal-dependent hydrolase
MSETIHRAQYIVADSCTLVPNGGIRILDDGRIAEVAPWNRAARGPSAEVVDWGAAVILPGFINAHAHLELTSLRNRLSRYASFTDWLSQLIALRRSWDTAAVRASIQEGIAQSLASGTTTVGDISSTGIVRSAARSSPIRKVVFEESISLSPGQAGEKIAEVKQALEFPAPGDLFRQGISPHAPYTVSGDLYRGLADLARSCNIPLATHIAETEAEIRFLQTGTGEFMDFLRSMNALPDDWNPPGSLPIPYLHALGVLGTHCLLIHGNYVDRESISRIADSGSSVVYCPRSHAFFGHREHPARKLLDAGVNVALGTDSLASNTSLSMLDEMRFLYRKRNDLKPEEILQAATVNGAKALNFGNDLGKLKPGCWADMTVLELPSNINETRIVEQILEGAGNCSGTVVGGKIIWRKMDTG